MSRELRGPVVKNFQKAKPYKNALRQSTPFVFYGVAMIALGVSAVASGPPAPSVIAILLLLGLLSWGLYEYLVHRFVLHHDARAKSFALPGNEVHQRHHANPLDLERLYVTLREGAPVSAAYALLMWLLLGSWQAMAFAYIGFHAGYFFYEWLDYQAHHGRPRSRIIRYLKKYHLQHHHVDGSRRYGVTSPLFDLLFGTFHLEKERVSKPARAGRRA
jgi:sterol desaturase/sphingolipid hydroxylase (fatty acid hydroxylase superfamily)